MSENIVAEEKENTTPSMPKMPQMPDGKGLDYKQVASLLAEKSKVVVEPDDPVMMLLPILNCFLAEEELLLKKHNEALKKVLGERTDYYFKNVEDVSNKISVSLSSVALTTFQETFEKQNEIQKQSNSIIRWASMIVLFSAFINVAVLVVSLFYRS